MTAPRPVRARRRFLRTAVAALLGAGAGGAFAREAAYPVRPIKLWVPWAAGGATDLTMRLLAELASPILGQRIVIENRGGAGGTLTMSVLQSAEPDGYTISQLPQTVFRAYYTQSVPWHPIRDTTPIIQISGVTFGVLVAEASRFRRLEDLFDYARLHPGELSIATNGVGTSPHLVLEELFTARGLSYIHVPYKGVAEQLTAVMSGQVMVGVGSTGFGPMVDNGRLRLLVLFSAQRSRRWPQVPTLRDLGFDIVAQSPYGIAGPAGLPPHVVATLHDAFKRAMFDAQFIQELDKYDQEPDYLGPDDYARQCRVMFEKEREIVERLGLARRAGS